MASSLISVNSEYHAKIRMLANRLDISMAKLIYGFVDRAIKEIGLDAAIEAIPAFLEQEKLYTPTFEITNPVKGESLVPYLGNINDGISASGLSKSEARIWSIGKHPLINSIAYISGYKDMRIRNELIPLFIKMIGDCRIVVQEKTKDRFFPVNKTGLLLLEAVGRNSHNKKVRWCFYPEDICVLWHGGWKITYKENEHAA